NGHIYILQQYLYLCTGEVRSAFTRPVLAFHFDMTRFRVAFAWIRSIPTAHVTTVACPYKELAGRVCLHISSPLSLLFRWGNGSGNGVQRPTLPHRYHGNTNEREPHRPKSGLDFGLDWNNAKTARSVPRD